MVQSLRCSRCVTIPGLLAVLLSQRCHLAAVWHEVTLSSSLNPGALGAHWSIVARSRFTCGLSGTIEVVPGRRVCASFAILFFSLFRSCRDQSRARCYSYLFDEVWASGFSHYARERKVSSGSCVTKTPSRILFGDICVSKITALWIHIVDIIVPANRRGLGSETKSQTCGEERKYNEEDKKK